MGQERLVQLLGGAGAPPPAPPAAPAGGISYGATSLNREVGYETTVSYSGGAQCPGEQGPPVQEPSENPPMQV